MTECYLDVHLRRRPQDVYALLKKVRYEIGGQTLEAYGGDVLRILASFEREAVVHVSDLDDGTCKVVMPLRLCTRALPLICLRFHEVRVHITLASLPDVEVLSRSLSVTYTYLDSDERRKLAQNEQVRDVFLKRNMNARVMSDGKSSQSVCLDSMCLGPAREIFVLVKQRQASVHKEPVRRLGLRVNEHMRHDMLDSVYTRRVFPHRFYGMDPAAIDRFLPPGTHLHVLPSDHTPTAEACSAALHDGDTRLVLDLLPGEYDLVVLARTFNVLTCSFGMAVLKYSV